MSKQIDMFGKEEKLKADRRKRNWENAFQSWSNKKMNDGTESYGNCGFGFMCDYCEDVEKGKPCVRALNKLLKDKDLKLDYSNRNFEEIWKGVGMGEKKEGTK